MGQIGAKLVKPFRNYNVDNRAAKVLERRQKVAEPAPYYPSTVDKLSRFRDEHSEFLESQKIRDEKLHGYLKNVYVESSNNLIQPISSSKPLPLNRIQAPETEMGALEHSGDVPEGRVTLKTVFSILGQHLSDPQNFTVAKIAQEHKLDDKDVANMLQFFKILHLHLPKEFYEENKNMKKLIAKQLKGASSLTQKFVLSAETEKPDTPKKDLLDTKT